MATSICNNQTTTTLRVFLAASRTVQPTGECAAAHSTSSLSCSDVAFCALMRTFVRIAEWPAEIVSSRPSIPRLSPSPSTVTSSFVRLIPERTACAAITVEQHAARDALKNQPGLGCEPPPPQAGGMSVSIDSPKGPVTRHFNPLCSVAVAGAYLARALSG